MQAPDDAIPGEGLIILYKQAVLPGVFFKVALTKTFEEMTPVVFKDRRLQEKAIF
jgi:hypothetical protein